MDVSKSRAATKPDNSRLNPLSRMLKQPRTNSSPQPAGAPAKGRSSAADPAAQLKPKPVATSTATIGATLSIKGDIRGQGDVFVSGTIEGSINLSDNDVTVEESGRVKGSIVAKRAQIKGKVIGDIEALGKITISSTGTVRGTIVAPRVEVEDGAKFKGRIEMDFDASRDAGAPVSLPKN